LDIIIIASAFTVLRRVTELKTKFEQGRRDLRSSTPRAIADGLEQIDLLVAREVTAKHSTLLLSHYAAR
jgi:hypothetical protein